jgi:Ni/Fe-hydrogenase b-type cytochrome subunit
MKFDEPIAHANVEIELGAPVAFGDHDVDSVVRLAAAGAPPGSDDKLDRALVSEAARRGRLASTTSTSYTEPGPEHPYSIAEVADEDGRTIRIARGDPRTLVEQLVHPSTPRQLRAITTKAELSARAFRPLAVATKTGDGSWDLVGYVPVRVWSQPGRRHGQSFDYHIVWDLWLRMCHWGWVAAIIVLTVTGYVIANPGWIPARESESSDLGFFMGYVRYVHLLAAVTLVAILVVRVWNLSTSKVPYDRWKALVPWRDRHQAANGFRTLQAYLFIRPKTAPEYFGHNPLQQLTYTVMYGIFLLQVVTGLALWGLYDAQGWFWGLFQGLNHLMGTQQVRLLHYVIMWIVILFVPLHVYLSIRADSVDRSGAISAMVSGGRWVRRGATFEDWPHQPTVGSRRGRAAMAAVAAEAATDPAAEAGADSPKAEA